MLDLTPIIAADAPAATENKAYDRCEFLPLSEKCLAFE